MISVVQTDEGDFLISLNRKNADNELYLEIQVSCKSLKTIKTKVFGAQFSAQKGVPSDDIMKPVRKVKWTKNPAQYFQFKLNLNVKVLTQNLV